MSQDQEITLRVAEPRPWEFDTKIARLSDYAIRQVGIKPRDYIEIIGPRASAPARAMLAEDIADDEIGIDESIWKFIGVGLGDEVKVRKADVKRAIRIVLAPIEQTFPKFQDFHIILGAIKYGRERVKYDILMSKPLTKGETISIPYGADLLEFVVVETMPLGYVYVTRFTEIEIREKPVKESEIGRYSKITREDTRDIKFLGTNTSSPPNIKVSSSSQTSTKSSSTSPSTSSSNHVNSVPSSNNDILAKTRSFQSRARDILEAVVAAVLQDLGFEVNVDAQIPAKDKATKEVDVWAQKKVLNIPIRVYVSCKNHDGNVDSLIVEQEIGRVGRLIEAPSIKFIVASQFSEQARKATISNEFIPIQIGFKVNKDNINEILEAYKRIYRIMYAIFSSMSPKRL